jgi:hypothetical protein
LPSRIDQTSPKLVLSPTLGCEEVDLINPLKGLYQLEDDFGVVEVKLSKKEVNVPSVISPILPNGFSKNFTSTRENRVRVHGNF